MKQGWVLLDGFPEAVFCPVLGFVPPLDPDLQLRLTNLASHFSRRSHCTGLTLVTDWFVSGSTVPGNQRMPVAKCGALNRPRAQHGAP